MEGESGEPCGVVREVEVDVGRAAPLQITVHQSTLGQARLSPLCPSPSKKRVH